MQYGDKTIEAKVTFLTIILTTVDQIPRDPAIPQKVCGICDAGFAGLDFGQKGQKKGTFTNIFRFFSKKSDF